VLDKYLPEYLKTVTPLLKYGWDTSRASQINTLSGGRVYRRASPQNVAYPYIVVGQGFNIDYGMTAGRNLLREVGHYNVVVVGRDFDSIDVLYRDVVDALKMVRNQYLPSADAAEKLWCQCIILQEGESFKAEPLDGSNQEIVGYIIPIRSGYDT
jgi:hypothetical protein